MNLLLSPLGPNLIPDANLNFKLTANTKFYLKEPYIYIPSQALELSVRKATCYYLRCTITKILVLKNTEFSLHIQLYTVYVSKDLYTSNNNFCLKTQKEKTI